MVNKNYKNQDGLKGDYKRKYPSRERIDLLLKVGLEKNPGKWVNHSRTMAQVAYKIAEDLNMDPDFAYACGALHDIGRTDGFSYIDHILRGYRILEDYPDVAKICLTHSFPIKDARTYGGKIDISQEDFNFIIAYIEKIDYDDYDLLIQLLDSCITGDGCVIQEKRFIDVGLRYGIKENSPDKWKKLIGLRKYFESKLGKSIYAYMDDVYENSLGTI